MYKAKIFQMGFMLRAGYSLISVFLDKNSSEKI